MQKIVFVVVALFAFAVLGEKPVDPAPNEGPSKKETIKKEKALPKPGMTGEELKDVGTKKPDGKKKKSDDKKKSEDNAL